MGAVWGLLGAAFGPLEGLLGSLGAGPRATVSFCSVDVQGLYFYFVFVLEATRQIRAAAIKATRQMRAAAMLHM